MTGHDAMEKKYRSTKRIKYLILIFFVVSLSDLLLSKPVDSSFFFRLCVYILLSISLFISQTKTIAEIKGDKLLFYTGIGFNDPSEIRLDEISRVERRGKRLLLIVPEFRKEFSVNADKTVIDQLENDFRDILN
ncbi:hypothetical protein J7K93_10015 [bacterium]|nr:hypothetical protein [bacterium]